jgi:hypothetical protein
MAPMARTPVYCTNTDRNEKYVNGDGARVSASSQRAVSRRKNAAKATRMDFIELSVPGQRYRGIGRRNFRGP